MNRGSVASQTIGKFVVCQKLNGRPILRPCPPTGSEILTVRHPFSTAPTTAPRGARMSFSSPLTGHTNPSRTAESWEINVVSVSTIHPVTNNRKANLAEVSSDLVFSPRFDRHLDEGASHFCVVGNPSHTTLCLTPIDFAVDQTDRIIDGILAVNDCPIPLLDRSSLE